MRFQQRRSLVAALIILFSLTALMMWAATSLRGRSPAPVQAQAQPQAQAPAPPPAQAGSGAQADYVETAYDAGEVDAGAELSHTYRVKNTGKTDLLIESVKPG
jgi:hypothetical protein